MERKAGHGALTHGQADWLPSSLWEVSLKVTQVERTSERSVGRHLLLCRPLHSPPPAYTLHSVLTTFLALFNSLTTSRHVWVQVGC